MSDVCQLCHSDASHLKVVVAGDIKENVIMNCGTVRFKRGNIARFALTMALLGPLTMVPGCGGGDDGGGGGGGERLRWRWRRRRKPVCLCGEF